MLKGSLPGVSPDAKGLGSKAVAVMLTVVLALMAWSPATIGSAFADGDEGAKPSATADSNTEDGKAPAASQSGKAGNDSEDPSPDAGNPSNDKPASDNPPAADGNGENVGNDSGTGTDEPEGTGEDDGNGTSTDGEETDPAGDGDETTPADEGEGDDSGNEANPDGAQSGEDTPSGDAASDNEEADPATPANDKPQGNDPQADGTIQEGAAQALAGMGKVHPEIIATAKVLSKPANGKTYGAGETIKFSITVRNTGDIPLYSIRVNNLVSGAVSAPVVAEGDGYAVSGTIASIALLAPGKRVSIPVSYKVLAADAGASISSTAVVKAVNPINPQSPISTSASTDSVKVTSISKPTAAPKAVAPPAPTTPIASVGEPVAKIEREAKPVPTVEPQRKTPPDKKDDAKDEDKGSWQLSDMLPIGVVGALCLAVLIAALIHKRREAAQNAEG